MIPQTNVYVPPDVQTVKTLNLIAGIFTIFSLIIGIFLILIIVGIIIVIFDIIILWYIFSRIPNDLNKQQYVQAKSDTVIAMIFGFLFALIIPGIVLLIAYLKYDDIIRRFQKYHRQTQPQQQI